MNPREFFDEVLDSRLASSDAVPGLSGTFVVRALGSDGGAWTVSLGKKRTCEKGEAAEADCRIDVQSGDLDGCLRDLAIGVSLFREGRITVAGPLQQARPVSRSSRQ